MGSHRYELKDSEWNRIAEMLPKEHPSEGKRGRPTKYDMLPKDDYRAVYWLKLAAEGGDALAQTNYGVALQTKFTLRKHN